MDCIKKGKQLNVCLGKHITVQIYYKFTNLITNETNNQIKITGKIKSRNQLFQMIRFPN